MSYDYWKKKKMCMLCKMQYHLNGEYRPFHTSRTPRGCSGVFGISSGCERQGQKLFSSSLRLQSFLLLPHRVGDWGHIRGMGFSPRVLLRLCNTGAPAYPDSPMKHGLLCTNDRNHPPPPPGDQQGCLWSVLSAVLCVCLQIHVVHYSSRFESFQEAASEPGGLAVLAAFLQVIWGGGVTCERSEGWARQV